MQINQARAKTALLVAPPIFAAISIYLTRSSVGLFFILAAVLITFQTFVAKSSPKLKADYFSILLITLASIGLVASGILTLEKIELLKNPTHVTSCSLSPIVACSPVINSKEATAFVFPNPVYGIFGFGAILGAGYTLLSLTEANRKKLSKWWWRSLLGATAGGFLFVIWLISEALYEIGSLCLYCIATWVIVAPLFFFTLKESLEEKALNLRFKKLEGFLQKYPLELTFSFYLIVALLILNRFWSYWLSLI